MSMQVDGVDFFTAILDRMTGKFVCWYYTPEGEELVKNLDADNRKYTLLDVAVQSVESRGMPQPVGYTPPTLPLPYQDCEVPPYTDEQLVILNTLHGIENLQHAVAELPTRNVQMQTMVPMVDQRAVIELIEKFRRDFQDGKIA